MRFALLHVSLVSLALACAVAAAAEVVPEPFAECARAQRPPVVDGKLNEACWQNTPAIGELRLPGDKGPATEQTQVLLAYDAKGLYVAFRCAEPEMHKLKVDEVNKLWRNDSVEVMVASDEDRRGYYQFVLTAGGARMQILNGVPGESPDYKWQADWQGATHRSETGWTAEMLIPATTLKLRVRDGLALRANFARNEQGLVERSSWTPRVGLFTNAVYFGNVILGRRAPVLAAEVSFPDELSAGAVSVGVKLSNPGDTRMSVTPAVRVSPGRRTHLRKVTIPPRGHLITNLRVDLPIQPECGLEVWAEADSGVDEQLLASYRITSVTHRPRAVGAVLANGAWGTAWEACATFKVMPDMAPPRERSRGIELFCARNEYEPFQIVLTPKWDLLGLKATVSDLAGPGRLSARSITVRRVDTVPVETPTSPDCVPGDWPDPLVPFDKTDLPAGRSTALWFTIHVPDDARPGEYSGQVTLSAEGIDSVAVPLKLRVWSFALPEVTLLQTAYGCDYDALCNWHGVSSRDGKRRLAELVNRNFIEHRVAPINPLRYWDLDNETVDGKMIVDFSDYDLGASAFIPKLSAFNLPGAFMGRVGREGPGTEEYSRLKIAFLKELAAYLRSKGWLEKGYAYIYDEPNEEHYAMLIEEARLWREADRGLRVLLTEQPEEPLFGSVDIWSPVLDAYIRKNCQARQAAGDEVWWYVCMGPRHPFPNNFIDYPAIDHRILHWMNWKFGVTGVLYWQTMFWTQDPWTKTMCRSEDGKTLFGNGDGVLLYPSVRQKSGKTLVEGPLDSIRWEMIREGIEDYDYLRLLDDAVKSAVDRGDAKLARIGTAALTDAGGLVRTTADYEKDPRKLYTVRRKVAEALERLIVKR